MRINELLTESQLQHLEEGPILNKIGSAVGNAARGVANTVGAVAGGVAGAGQALKRGYQTGKAFVGNEPAAGGTTPPSAQDINAQGPAGTAPAVAQTGAAGAALAKTTAAVDKQTTAKAGQTVYAQVKANVDKLDKKGKQRILQLLQKSMATPDPKPTAGAPKPGAAPAPAGGAPAADPAAPANTMANAPVSATNTADPSNPNLAQPAADAAAPAAEPAAGQGAFANVAQPLAKPTGRAQGGGKVAGELSQNPRAVKRRADRAAAAAAKQPAAVTASLVHHGKSLNEVLAQKLEMHKRRMFESALSQGTASVFVK